MEHLRNFVRFARPHTVIGTSLSILALYFLALSVTAWSGWHLAALGWTLLACLGANIYIVGLNQITDVAIDRINKPYLPLASGAYSMSTGYWLIGIALALSLAIAIPVGGYLLLTVGLSLLIGTVYSLPPVRLKRFTFWAAFCIIAVRGMIVNIFLFLHFHTMMATAPRVPAVIWLLTGTIFVYSIVIAWFKDMPDIEGDERYRIRTLSLRMGAREVFRLGNLVLATLFLTLIVAAWQFDLGVSAGMVMGAHALFLLLLLGRSRQVKLDRQQSLWNYYQFIWGLFFLEYLTFASAGWMG